VFLNEKENKEKKIRRKVVEDVGGGSD